MTRPSQSQVAIHSKANLRLEIAVQELKKTNDKVTGEKQQLEVYVLCVPEAGTGRREPSPAVTEASVDLTWGCGYAETPRATRRHLPGRPIPQLRQQTGSRGGSTPVTCTEKRKGRQKNCTAHPPDVGTRKPNLPAHTDINSAGDLTVSTGYLESR